MPAVTRQEAGITRRDLLKRAGAVGPALSLPYEFASVAEQDNHVQESPILASHPSRTWAVQSVDMMKITQDAVRNQLEDARIVAVVELAKDLGATHVAIGTPYDDPEPQNSSIAYTSRWIKAIREVGLNIWHRHMPLEWEGFYDKPKKKRDFKPMIQQYIEKNDFFYKGDIFAPFPEPENGGIRGMYCAQNVCQFDGISDFNQQLQEYIGVSREAFIKKGFGEDDIFVGMIGLNGFTVGGLYNPTHEGKTQLTRKTILAMVNLVTMDHHIPKEKFDSSEITIYEAPRQMKWDYEVALAALRRVSPDAKIGAGELGPPGHNVDLVSHEEVILAYEETLRVLSELAVVMNLWPFVGGSPRENLIAYDSLHNDFVATPLFDKAKLFYKPTV